MSDEPLSLSELEARGRERAFDHLRTPVHTQPVVLPARRCETCSAVVVYDHSHGAFGAWVHADPKDDEQTPVHFVAAAPQCPKCGSARYVTTQPAWGIASDCADCGHHSFVSIGD